MITGRHLFVPPFVVGVVTGFVALSLVLAFTESTPIERDEYWRDEAVKHGAAEYYLDDKHQRQWRWKTPGDSL